MRRLFIALGILYCVPLNAQYTGTPYPDGIPHPIPGIIEAEHFDNGGEGISWHDTNAGQEANEGLYRPDTDVEFEHRGGNNYSIGWSGGGEWLKYTVAVESTGYYQVTFLLARDGSDNFVMEV
ncbi:MAG: hypothetical protein LBT25_00005, partial [Candidatus Symbiothrix sp.]|nr:hypothetical protein [Candidatus Symbiothrix sp.]